MSVIPPDQPKTVTRLIEASRRPIIFDETDEFDQLDIYPVVGDMTAQAYNVHQAAFSYEVIKDLDNGHGIMTGQRVMIRIADLCFNKIRDMRAPCKSLPVTIERDIFPDRPCTTVLRSPTGQVVITLRLECMIVRNTNRDIIRRECGIVISAKHSNRDFREDLRLWN